MTHPGRQDYQRNEKMSVYLVTKEATPNAYMPDTDGSVGLSDGANTTPHRYVINLAGVPACAGVIDDKRGANSAKIAGAKTTWWPRSMT